MKAILVIDTPKDCYGCPCYQGMSGDSFCGVLNEDTMINTDTKPKHCPLKPMPQKKILMKFEDRENKEYECLVRGYNKCIDDISGEQE